VINQSLKKLPRALLLVLLVLAIIYSEAIAAPLPGLGDDGWYTWRVEAVDGNTIRCCTNWNHGDATRTCNLDDRRSSTTCGGSQSSDEAQIYVRTEAGEVTKIRTLSPQCPVDAESSIQEIDPIDNATSVDWLNSRISPGSDLSEDAIAAIAAHAGTESFAVLRDTARSNNDAETREQALFRMAATARSGSEAEIFRAIARDPSQKVREEAVFAMSLLPGERGLGGLIAVLENRSYEMRVREQALFWLAQSDSDEAFDYVDGLLGAN